MDDKLVKKITKLIDKTSSNLIRWKRVNKTTYEYKKTISFETTDSNYPQTINTITTIQKKSGNFLVGKNTFYTFTIIEENEKEILVELEADKNENNKHFSLLDGLFNKVLDYYNQRGNNIFEKIIE